MHCSGCGTAIDDDDAFCSNCGKQLGRHQNLQTVGPAAVPLAERDAIDENFPKFVALVLAAILLCVVGLYATGAFSTDDQRVASTDATSTTLSSMKDDVARDAEHQYELADQSGNKIDKCVQAGMVAAAYLQADNADKYREWVSTRNLDCAVAGIHEPQ